MYSTESITTLFSNNKPPAHILMPLYNANKFVRAALESVLIQNYSNLKILIYNDGSNDGSLEIIEKLLQEKPAMQHKIDFKNSQSNQGVAHARIQLYKWSRELAKNSYIFWLDADDRYTRPDFIQLVIDQMLRAHADVCLFNFSIKYEDETQKNNAIGLLKDKENMARFLNVITDHPSKSLSPSDVPDILKFTSLGWTKCYAPTVQLPTPADCPYEDFVFMAVLLEIKKITALPSEIEAIEYLRRSTSICGQRKECNFTNDIPAQLKIFFDIVLKNSENAHDKLQRLNKAQEFVASKFDQYRLTLQKLIETEYVGINQQTLEIFNKKAKELLDYVAENLKPQLNTRSVLRKI